MSSDFSTTNRWADDAGSEFSLLCKEFLEQLEMIDGALMCHYTAPKLLTEKLRALKDTGKFGTGGDDDLFKPTLLRNSSSLSGAITDGGATSSAASTPAFRSVPPSPEKLTAVTGFDLDAEGASTKLERTNDVGDTTKEAEHRQLRISPSTRELFLDPDSASRRVSLAPVCASKLILLLQWSSSPSCSIFSWFALFHMDTDLQHVLCFAGGG